ncbi:MAG TPA: SURF1 family protein [Acetobacteraceae bacterium]|nr:SURF1 family protein [Acetobacteraceae bacterium]
MSSVARDTPTHAARRSLLWPGAMTLLMLLALLGLGTWQVRRLHWKQDILARIAAAEAAPPVPLPAAPAPFQKVRVTGHFLPGRTALYGVEVRDGPAGPVMGRQVIAPLAADGRVVLVDRGWSPEGTIPAPPDGPVTVVGYARPPENPRFLAAPDSPARREFFTLNPTSIAASLGLSNVAPFTLVALGPPAGTLIPAEHLPRPMNNHLSYAVTWYGLAFALAIVFIAWARGRRMNDTL